MAVGLGTLALLVLWVVAAGQETVCTNDYLCTAARCPERCKLPERVLLGSVPALVAAGAASVWLVRRWGRWSVAAVPLVAVTIGAGAAMTAW